MFIFRWFWSILKGALNMIARAVVTIILLLIVLAVIGSPAAPSLPDNMVLTLDLRRDFADKTSPDLFALEGNQMSLLDVVLALDSASRDDRVRGLFMRIGSGDLSVPKAEELREALKTFKDSGKFVIAHSQSFYSGGLGDFDVAAVADEIWMQPASSFFASGTGTTTLFFRGLLDNIDAVPQFVQRYEYKNATNIFTETGFTPEHREATGRILQSWYDTATTEIAGDLQMDRDTLIAILDQSPMLVDDAIEEGLITHIGYDDEARDAALAHAGSDAELAEFTSYVRSDKDVRSQAQGPVFALVHAVGEIVEGELDGPLSNAIIITGDDFAEAIRDASEDTDVEAILLRVDSPGGSAIASDQILDAIKRAQAVGIPVVVSMGSVAASGGYYISASADRIVANPGTLTGSIGVLWGKIATGGSFELVGVHGEELGVGQNALFLSGLVPWNEAQLAEVNAQADATYEDFTEKVAEGRNMPLEEVQAVARGRVWTGADAAERGLVDELGGFWTAVASAKNLAGVDAATEVVFREYPRQLGFFERWEQAFALSSAGLSALRGLDRIVESETVQAVISATRDAPRGNIEFRAVGLPE
jgi:protease-4